MTGTINRIVVQGHLGRDPEIFVSDTGREIARLTIATNERFTDRNGKTQERTEWHRAVIFGEGLITQVAKPHLKKGSKVLIKGSNRTDKYTDKNGVERYSTDIIVRELTLLDPKENEK